MPVSWNRQAAAITTSASRGLHPVVGHHRRLDARRGSAAGTGAARCSRRSGCGPRSGPTCRAGRRSPAACTTRRAGDGRRWRPRAAPPGAGCRAWARGSRPRDLHPGYPTSDEHGSALRRPRPPHLRPPRLGHRPLQLPLPVLHAGRGPALARARRDAQLRGDRAAGAVARADGRHRRAADRRRAAGAARVPAAWSRCSRRVAGRRGPVAHHQRLPARARRRRAGRRPASRASTSRSTRSARPLLPDHPARLAAAGAARPRGDRRAPRACRPIKVNAVAMRDFTEEEAIPFAEFARSTELPGALHRVHAARRRPRLEPGPGAHRRGAARDHRRASTRSRSCRASRTPPRASSASPTARARSASSTRSPSRSAPTATASG